tara:strand:+ start:595 stop:981 length:387 start_codon:yes stop_codon:yes gene_type:complete
MRTLFLALATTLFASSVTAADITTDLALNTDVTTTHKWDAATTTIILNPELSYTGLGFDTTLTIGTKLNVWDNANQITLDDELDHAPVFDFGIAWLVQDNLELEATTSYDLEAGDRSEDIKFVATFSF